MKGLLEEKTKLESELKECSAKQGKDWKFYYDDTSVQSDDIELESESSAMSEDDEEDYSTANKSNDRGGICRANERSNGGDQEDYTREDGYACTTPYRKESSSTRNRIKSCEKKRRGQVGDDTRLFSNLQRYTERCYYE